MSKKNEIPTLPPQAKRSMGIKASNAISNTIIYCLLIVIVINFRTQGILGERELSLEGARQAAKKLNATRKEAKK